MTYTMDDKAIPIHYFERYNKYDILQRIDCDTRQDGLFKHCQKIDCLRSETFNDRMHCIQDLYPEDEETNDGEHEDSVESMYDYIEQDKYEEGQLSGREIEY